MSLFCGTKSCSRRRPKKFIHEYEVGSAYTADDLTMGKITFTVEEIVPVSTSTLTGEKFEEPGLLVNINGVSDIKIIPHFLSNVKKKSDGGGLKPRKGRKGKKGKKGKKNRNNKTKRKSRRKTKNKSTKKKQRTKRRN